MTSKRPELSLLRAIRRSVVSLRRVIEVGLDGRRRASEPLGDLGDRESLRLPVVLCEHHRLPPFGHAIH